MAQAGFTPIQLYRSSTASAVPSASNMQQGELAINITDGKLYFKNASNVVTLLAVAGAAGSGTVTSVSGSGGTTGLTLSGGPIISSGTLTLGGTLGTNNGGTGQTTYTDGQLLIGNTSTGGLTKTTLTAGSGIAITNGNGSITIAATAGPGGTVTGVTATFPITSTGGTAPVIGVAHSGGACTTSTGTGALVFSTSPTLTTPNLGTPSALTLTNATGLPISTGVSGLGTGVATALAVNTGSAGAFVVQGGALGTPSSGTLTNATGLPLSTGVTGTLPIANGGTNATDAATARSNLGVASATGSGASGTWAINISGTSASASFATSAGSATSATSANTANTATTATNVSGGSVNATTGSFSGIVTATPGVKFGAGPWFAGWDGGTNLNFDYPQNTTRIQFTSGGGANNVTGVWGIISDRRIKENIVPARNYLDDLCKLEVVNYNLINNSQKMLGFVAQQVEEFLPGLVETAPNPGYDIEDFKSLKTSIMIPMLVQAVQELKAELDTAKAKIAALEAK